METSLGQYCLNVSDLERSVAFYTEVLGLEVHSRTEIPGTHEAIVWGRGKGSALQLAEHVDETDPIDQSVEGIKKVGALWKLYLNTDDVKGLHAKAVEVGAKSVMEPTFRLSKRSRVSTGTPGGTRTPDPQVRSLAEAQAKTVTYVSRTS